MTRFSDLLRQAADAWDAEQAAIARAVPIPLSAVPSATGGWPPTTAAEKPGDTQQPGRVALPPIIGIHVRGAEVRVVSEGPLKQGFNLVLSKVATPSNPSMPTYSCALSIASDGTSGVGLLSVDLPAGDYDAWFTDPVTYAISPVFRFTQV